jgi:transposase
MTTVARKEDNQEQAILHLAFELSAKQWVLAFTTGLGQKARIRRVEAGAVERLGEEIERAKRRFGLPESARVVSCYEAGLDGFWLHRVLESVGIENVVVDSASIEVKRGRRRAKTDRLDVGALVMLLVRFARGERKVWSVVRVPPEWAEDQRHNDRELTRLSDERTANRNLIRGLLKTQGIALTRWGNLPEQLQEVRTWNGEALGSELHARLLRHWERLQLIEKQIKEVRGRRQDLMEEATPVAAKARQLLLLKGVGENTAWELATEVFGWRRFQNRRQVGALAGLTPVPYDSGEVHRDQGGISRIGRVRLRANLIELAWMWLRYQPTSGLALWYERRFASGGKRMRRIGIVALARRLLVDLWRFTETGALPEGARTKA